MTIKPFVDRPSVDVGEVILVIPSTGGMNTSQIDQYRQGISVRDWSDFSKSSLPLISDRGFPPSQRDRFDPSIEKNHFGQPKLFKDPSPARVPGVSDGPGPSPFNDIVGILNPVTYIEDPGTQSYPIILLSPNWLDPSMMDGIIEPFAIRRSLINSSIGGPVVAHTIRGALQPNTGPDILGRGGVVSRFIEFMEIDGDENEDGKKWGISPWIDSQNVAMSEDSFYFPEEGYADVEQKCISPFDDSAKSLLSDYIKDPSLQFPNREVSFGNFIDDPRFGIFGKSATSGIECRGGNFVVSPLGTGNQLVNGTDSIAFGGLLK